jgi:hypothetical protein
MRHLEELVMNFTSPLTTTGMGDVTTTSEPVGVNKFVKNKNKKYKKVANGVTKCINESKLDDCKMTKCSSYQLSKFLIDTVNVDENDVNIFIKNNPSQITEYAFYVDDPEFYLEDTSDVFKYMSSGIYNENGFCEFSTYWVNNGNGLNTIVCALIPKNPNNPTEYHVFGTSDVTGYFDEDVCQTDTIF